MSPSRRVLIGALQLILWAGGMAAVPASAQLLDDARRFLDLAPDPLARSPRLLGMGQLSLMSDEANNRLTLWDFAGNPTGVVEADSVSTLELRPRTSSASSLHDFFTPNTVRQRQDLAARDFRVGYEAWHRTSAQSSYGVIGDMSSLRFDRPWTEDVELRSQFSQPSAMPILCGRMPVFLTDRMRYALRLALGYQTVSQRYRSIVSNGAGEYIDLNGQIGSPPEFFTPTDYTVRTFGSGAAVSYRFGDYLTAAAGLDRTGLLIKGSNEGGRYSSETREERPYSSGQGTLIGRVGEHLRWGADVRGWKSSSDERWVFSLSEGQGAVPLAGRGKLLDREEEGSTLRSRASWQQGALELGAAFNTSYRKTTITVPTKPSDMSFNAFRNALFYLVGTDTLVVPDSVSSNQFEERGWESAGGATWRLPGRKGVVGAEYHRGRLLEQQRLNGLGPRRTQWDVRAGLEYVVNPVLAVRGGFIHGWEDRDEFTKQNEYISNALTLGAGVAPAGSIWRVEWGYRLEWIQADFGDPGRPRETRQDLAMQVRWIF